MQVTLSEVDAKLAVDVASQTAARRVAADLEYRSAGRKVGRAAADQRNIGVAVIVPGGQRAPDVGDDRAELGRADGHIRAESVGWGAGLSGRQWRMGLAEYGSPTASAVSAIRCQTGRS